MESASSDTSKKRKSFEENKIMLVWTIASQMKIVFWIETIYPWRSYWRLACGHCRSCWWRPYMSRGCHRGSEGLSRPGSSPRCMSYYLHCLLQSPSAWWDTVQTRHFYRVDPFTNFPLLDHFPSMFKIFSNKLTKKSLLHWYGSAQRLNLAY